MGLPTSSGDLLAKPMLYVYCFVFVRVFLVFARRARRLPADVVDKAEQRPSAEDVLHAKRVLMAAKEAPPNGDLHRRQPARTVASPKVRERARIHTPFIYYINFYHSKAHTT